MKLLNLKDNTRKYKIFKIFKSRKCGTTFFSDFHIFGHLWGLPSAGQVPVHGEDPPAPQDLQASLAAALGVVLRLRKVVRLAGLPDVVTPK